MLQEAEASTRTYIYLRKAKLLEIGVRDERRVTVTANSRMRLAKGFFLLLIAAEMRQKICRPASGGVGWRRPASGEGSLEIIL